LRGPRGLRANKLGPPGSRGALIAIGASSGGRLERQSILALSRTRHAT